MLIVQISDVHCGPMFNKETFRTATKEINAMSPDAVVVTGDLARAKGESRQSTSTTVLTFLKHTNTAASGIRTIVTAASQT